MVFFLSFLAQNLLYISIFPYSPFERQSYNLNVEKHSTSKVNRKIIGLRKHFNADDKWLVNIVLRALVNCQEKDKKLYGKMGEGCGQVAQ